jgi:hypothetical protein
MTKVPKTAAIQSRTANVNGVKIHYLVAGKGEPVRGFPHCAGPSSC